MLFRAVPESGTERGRVETPCANRLIPATETGIGNAMPALTQARASATRPPQPVWTRVSARAVCQIPCWSECEKSW